MIGSFSFSLFYSQSDVNSIVCPGVDSLTNINSNSIVTRMCDVKREKKNDKRFV